MPRLAIITLKMHGDAVFVNDLQTLRNDKVSIGVFDVFWGVYVSVKGSPVLHYVKRYPISSLAGTLICIMTSGPIYICNQTSHVSHRNSNQRSISRSRQQKRKRPKDRFSIAQEEESDNKKDRYVLDSTAKGIGINKLESLALYVATGKYSCS